MDKRSENIRRINKIRSKETREMLFVLDALENGTDLDLGGYEAWDIQYAYKLKNQLNSYRAKKISMGIGKNINKQKLLKYAKSSDYEYELSNNEFNKWLETNLENLKKYWEYSVHIIRANIKINDN